MPTATPLAQKLKMKPGQRAIVVNAPEGYLKDLGRLPDRVEVAEKLTGKFDWIQLFVKNKAELEKILPRVARALKPESTLWISYPKGTSKIQTDLTRDKGWESLKDADLMWVNLISVNDTWSAFSLRPYKPGEKRQTFR
jgi:hypothetical protein